MNELKLYVNSGIRYLILCIILFVLGADFWLWKNKIFNEIMIQSIWVMSGILSVFLFMKYVRRRAMITLSIHGIQFHYPTKREHRPLFNQFVAWGDIQEIQLLGSSIIMKIDDNPPDYERLTEIELANLPPRELILYSLKAKVSGLSVSPKKLAGWLNQLYQSGNKERAALMLSFYYES